MRIKVKPGTHISRKSNSRVYAVDYQALLYCEPGCTWDHDCYTEPHVAVRILERTSIPLSDISHVFDRPNSWGRDFDAQRDVEE